MTRHAGAALVVPLAIVLAGTAACAGGPAGQLRGLTPPFPDPVSLAVNAMDTVLYLGVDLGTAGSVIGGHYDGLLKRYQGPNSLSPDLLATWTDAVRELGLETLETAGYPVRAASRLFSSFEEVEGIGAVIAGEAVSLTVDSYGRLAGNQTTTALTIRWELYDPESRRVTYSRPTSAEVSTSGVSGAAFGLAFMSSLSRFSRILGSVRPPSTSQIGERSPRPVQCERTRRSAARSRETRTSSPLRAQASFSHRVRLPLSWLVPQSCR